MRGSVRRRGRGAWQLIVDVGRDANGKRVRQFRTVRGTKAEAEHVLNQQLRAAEMSQGVMWSRVLLGEFMDRWLAERVYPRLRSQTCMLYARDVRLRLRPELGDIPLQRWRRGMCRPWKSVCPVVVLAPAFCRPADRCCLQC